MNTVSEGRVCRVRRARLDDPSRFNGHDKHAPPTPLSKGPVCRVRRATYKSDEDLPVDG